MERLSDNAIDIIDELHTKRLHYFSEYIPLIDAANLLAEYENTGLTPQEIEQMKARMPLHQWAGESLKKMSIFGVSVEKIMELIKAEKEGRLVVLASDKEQLRMFKDKCKICPYWNGESCNKTQCLVYIKIKELSK